MISISPYKTNHSHCEDITEDWVHVVPVPDTYRGKYSTKDHTVRESCQLYVDEVRQKIDKIKSLGRRGPAAFIVESMQSCGGQIIYPPGYLEKAFGIVKAAGGVCIADEVQTGFGRVGSNMWAFEIYGKGVKPDIVTVGKPMGNGYPISAVITTPAIAEAFSRGPDYFNTYGGNPVSCAVALAVLDIIESEKLRENARLLGHFLKEKFEALGDKFDIVGDVRGEGMFLGMDLVLDRNSRTPATEQAKDILYRLRDRGILMSRDGPYDNVLKFKAPLCFTLDNAKSLIKALHEILTDVTKTLVVEPLAKRKKV